MTQSIATARIKREFKEVVTSDEVDIYKKKVSEYIFFILIK